MSLSSRQMNEIMRGYEERRMRNRRLLEERRQEIYRTVPRYRELDHSSADLAIEKAKRLLSAKVEDYTSPLQSFADISAEKKKLLKEAGYSENYLEMHYDCPDCRDTGYIGSERCHCLNRAIIRILYQQSQIEHVLSRENFTFYTNRYYNDSEKAGMEHLYQVSRTYADTFSSHNRNLMFIGGVGCGKTFLSSCIAKEVLDQGHSVLYFTAFQLFRMISAMTFGSREEKAGLSSFYEDLFQCDLLVLDDLGTEGANSFSATQLFLILNERLIRNKSTVISSNLSVKKLEDLYSERSISRIIGGYELYLFQGEDIRRKKKNMDAQ